MVDVFRRWYRHDSASGRGPLADDLLEVALGLTSPFGVNCQGVR